VERQEGGRKREGGATNCGDVWFGKQRLEELTSRELLTSQESAGQRREKRSLGKKKSNIKDVGNRYPEIWYFLKKRGNRGETSKCPIGVEL